MTTKKIIYIANARLPTEKAHGYQISKMCEAFALAGLRVVLMHPRRRQKDPSLNRSVFDYYGIARNFEVRPLPNLDVVQVVGTSAHRWFAPLFLAHAVVWGLYAALMARREHADCYYTRDIYIAFWLARFGLPTVYEAHGVPRRAQRLLLRRLATARSVIAAVALTGFIKQRLIEIGFPAAKLLVLPDSVDPALFEGIPARDECRRRLGLPVDRPVIGYVGRFRTMEMEKGIPDLIRALEQLEAINGAQPLLLCVGGPREAIREYEELAARCNVAPDSLRFVDRVSNSEVPYWIRACDVVTIPWPWNEFSAYFTSPLKLFEYMASGVPIVATDLPAIREILRHGENGWLVEPDNPAALVESLRVVLSHKELAERLASHARSDSRQFTWERRAQEFVSAFMETSPC